MAQSERPQDRRNRMKRYIDLLKQTFNEWNHHEAPRMGAALAFYSVLSLAPLVILVVGICALVFGTSGAQTQILNQFRELVGDQGAAAIETVLKSAQKPTSGIIASIFGLITLLLGASGVFLELRAVLNKLWDAEQPNTASGIWAFIKDRFLSVGIVLAIGFLLLVSLVISAALGTAGKFFSNLGFLPPVVWEVFNFIVSLAAVAAMFGLILRFIPNIRLPWSDIGIGSALTAVLFTIGKTIIGLYLGKASVGSAYGAAGSLVVLVVWIYYSAQIFFFGAMFTRVYATAHGWEPVRAPGAEFRQPEGARPRIYAAGQARRQAESASVFAEIAAALLVLVTFLRKRHRA
ncbi:MAG: YihY/virulence factor BrkB family protein [Terriglobia bacterium]|nr:MAG: YihY/virulence factor BrkB family protein [Terriglobia bacterium]